jgi:hypothetical protein
MSVEPREEHRWLQRMVGDWTWESEPMEVPDQPAAVHTGTERVRSIGGLFVVAEGTAQGPDGTSATTIMTLGYDPAKRRYVGSFIGAMMYELWRYEGTVDAGGTTLVLDTEGPSFTEEGKTATYIDRIAFRGDDHRVLTSDVQGADGTWTRFMTAHYRRDG